MARPKKVKLVNWRTETAGKFNRRYNEWMEQQPKKITANEGTNNEAEVDNYIPIKSVLVALTGRASNTWRQDCLTKNVREGEAKLKILEDHLIKQNDQLIRNAVMYPNNKALINLVGFYVGNIVQHEKTTYSSEDDLENMTINVTLTNTNKLSNKDDKK